MSPSLLLTSRATHSPSPRPQTRRASQPLVSFPSRRTRFVGLRLARAAADSQGPNGAAPGSGSGGDGEGKPANGADTKMNKIHNEEVVAEDDIGGDSEDDDDALETLFKQLEEDLKNDDLSVEDDDDEGISEEDMARFEQELAEAIRDIGDADESAEDSSLGSEGYGNDEKTDEIEQPELKNWQLKRLARALKIGRRKISIKNLAGELGLDRSLVIELLRNPPPKLLFMSDSLPDEAPSKPEIKEIESSPVVDDADVTETKPQTELPVHVMCAEWSSQKRLKKVQLETLERVYSRTKRPTAATASGLRRHAAAAPRAPGGDGERTPAT